MHFVIQLLVLPYATVCIGFHTTYSFRWLKETGVSLGAEKKQRVLSNYLVGDNLEVELTPFSFAVSGGGEDIRDAPHTFTLSLTQKVHY